MTPKTHPFVPLIVFIAAVFASPPVHADDLAADLSEYMQACAKVEHFNGSVLVCKDNETVFKSGYGMANFEHDVPNAPDTKFRIGSITKQFTAMAILILEEQGKLKVGDPIHKYIADSPDAWADVTIHHLLTHTSGIPSFTGMPEYRRDMMLLQSINQMLARFKDKPLKFAPGEKFKYSNSGYLLLGAIIEKASNVSYEEFLRAEICDPLELNDTGYDRFRTVLKHRATGYRRVADSIVHDAYLHMSQPHAAGALYSTVEDLNRWDQALRRRELIADSRYQRMFTPEKNGYAYGWNVRTKSGRRSISHSGGINGFVSHILRYPDEKLCVVVLCNTLPASPPRVARDLAAIMLGEDYELPRAKKISLEATLNELVKDGSLVAAQAVVGRGDRILIDHAVGVTNPGGDQRVNAETLFCIGSCSKPFASAVVMSLVEDGLLELEQPINKHLPAFDNLQLPHSQQSERAPTMKELLAHRGGIYSQKRGMTAKQTVWIRNFGQSLEESVQGIAGEPLISPPGSEYAYSGAGYCVAGRVAEVAVGKPFEQLLQRRIAAPLTLKRTTYFPNAKDRNVAAGGNKGKANPNTPHLTKPALRFALVGGSLHSTAQETARFLRMVAQQGKIGKNEVMKRDSWRTWTSRPYAEGTYGFGWSLTAGQSTAQPASLSHSGSLASSRSSMVVELNAGGYSVVHYTVASDRAVGGKIRKAMEQAMRNRLQ